MRDLLHSGVAGTADVILLPEIPYDIEKVCQKVRQRDRMGRRFSVIVVAEGAYPRGGEESVIGSRMTVVQKPCPRNLRSIR